MNTLQRTPPGFEASSPLPPTAPVDVDGGFLDGVERELVPEQTEITGLAEGLIEYELTAPAGASEEVADAYWHGLPARDYWLVDPAKFKIATPYDAYGFIRDKELIRRAMATVRSDYPWPGTSDRHHLYWTADKFISAQEELGIPSGTFRDHHDNVVRIPRVLHNWIHAISEPPEIPEPEFMTTKLETWTSVVDFYNSLNSTVSAAKIFGREEKRRGGYTDEQSELLRDVLAKDMAGIIMHWASLQEIPQNFWPIMPTLRYDQAVEQLKNIIKKEGCKNRLSFVYGMVELREVA